MKKLNQMPWRQLLPVYISVQLENADKSRDMWLDLPVTKAKFAAAIAKIGCYDDNVRVTDYRAYGIGLTRGEIMATPLSVINYLAARLRKLTPGEMLKLRAISESEYFFCKAGQIIDYTFEADNYKLAPEITDAEELGRYYFPSEYTANKPASGDFAELNSIIAYKYGIEISELEKGAFTPHGYLTSKTFWRHTNSFRPVPDSLNLRGSLNEDLYGDWTNYDITA